MASKDSGVLQTNSSYTLGDYIFRIERSSGTSPNYDKIEAICTKGGKNARKSIQLPSSTQIQGWYVEANESEATVYIITEGSGLDTGPVRVPFSYGSSGSAVSADTIWTYSAPALTNAYHDFHHPYHIFACDSPGQTATGQYVDQNTGKSGTGSWPMNSSFTYGGKTVYYSSGIGAYWPKTPTLNPLCAAGQISLSGANIAAICWIMVYGDPQEVSETKMVGRFAIDLKDAGGVGPGSDWTDPGDYDEDWEPEDPTHTLYVEVIGALSGRHNDPIEDPSYSYIPTSNGTIKGYGFGGDGGYGGGGGAGASTVVIHKFATNQANSKEVIALARRHGYGSGGGKGGKGGDGCILVYY